MNDMRDTCVILEAPQNGLLCKSCWLKMMANITVTRLFTWMLTTTLRPLYCWSSSRDGVD